MPPRPTETKGGERRFFSRSSRPQTRPQRSRGLLGQTPACAKQRGLVVRTDDVGCWKGVRAGKILGLDKRGMTSERRRG